MVGALTSGRVSDLIGWKGEMWISSVFCFAGWLAVYFAKGAEPIDIGRLSTGYGMGLLSYVVPVTTIGALLMDRAGRRLLLFISRSGLVVGSVLVGTSFLMEAHEFSMEWVPALTLFGMLTYIVSFSIGMRAIPWVIMSENQHERVENSQLWAENNLLRTKRRD